jgi:putative addiction module component (TIGR02574 family)
LSFKIIAISREENVVEITRGELEEEAKHLPPKERALLVRDLLAGLDDAQDEDVEQAWLHEAERRCQAYRNGLQVPRSAEAALKKAKSLKYWFHGFTESA